MEEERAMTENAGAVPAALQTFIDATNTGDSDAFVAVFTDDAVLDDWGNVFRGRDGIASWNRTDNIGKQSHFELVSLEPTDDTDRVVATLRVTGNGFAGTGPMTFEFRGDRIARLVITPTD
jgi:ketosteroid isomerase-like protein